VEKLLTIIGMTAGGYAGWALGAKLSFFAAFVLGVVGTALGLYLARRLLRDHF
jgi:uncharacterized membrane protein YeaQ/YmgE (transglycosylase-associated protein family)